MAFGGYQHISKVLSNVAVEYKNTAYIAMEALGAVPVEKESDLYYTFNRNFGIPEARRANKAASNMISWGVSVSSYTLPEYALSDIVTDRDRANSDTIQMDQQTTEVLTNKIMANIELQAATLMFTTGTWGGNMTLNSATAWRVNTTGSTPVQNILSGTGYIIQNSGVTPNTLILGRATFDALKLNTDLTNRIQYVERAFATKEIMASLFDVQDIYVGQAVRDTGSPGVNENISFIWGPDAWLGYLEKSAGIKKLSAAYIFRMSDIKTKKWRREELAGDQIEVSAMAKTVAVATACGYFFKAAAT